MDANKSRERDSNPLESKDSHTKYVVVFKHLLNTSGDV